MAFDGNGSRLQARVVIEQYRERECLVYSALVWEVGWNQKIQHSVYIDTVVCHASECVSSIQTIVDPALFATLAETLQSIYWSI